jgi:uncharacterized GH25 family protein
MDKLVLMVGGHEIWLEASKVKASNAEVVLAYGHNMKQDGCPDKNRLQPMVFVPGGKRAEPDLKSVNEHYVMKFKGDKPGYYMPIVDLSPVILTNTKDKNFQRGPKNMYKDATYAGAYNQMAKTIIPMGDAGKYKPEHVHGILDIVPDRSSLEVGKTIDLTVLYEGKPLPGVEVKAVSKKEGKDMALVTTGKNGIAMMPIMVDGAWMFLVRYKDASKAVADQYDESVFVTTLTMETSEKKK